MARGAGAAVPISLRRGRLFRGVCLTSERDEPAGVLTTWPGIRAEHSCREAGLRTGVVAANGEVTFTMQRAHSATPHWS